MRELTDGVGVAAVYDGVGKDTFDGSLASIRRRGMMVLFGGSSGQVPPFDLQRLNRSGSLSVTRPTLGDFVVTRGELLSRCADLFGWVTEGRLEVRVGATYPLADAGRPTRTWRVGGPPGKCCCCPDLSGPGQSDPRCQVLISPAGWRRKSGSPVSACSAPPGV